MRNKRLKTRLEEKEQILDKDISEDKQEQPIKPVKEKRQKKSRKKKEKPESLHLEPVSPLSHQIHFGKVFTKVGTALIILLCVYLCFLTYGVVVTEYVYDDDGKVVPQIVTVEDIKKKKEFNKLQDYYIEARRIYEKTLTLDYELGQSADDAVLIASEYSGLVDDVDSLYTKLNGTDFSTKYNVIKGYLLNWLSEHETNGFIKDYLTCMPIAIQGNNVDSANRALICKDNTYVEFNIITQLLVSLSKDVKGVDVTDIEEWSVAGYIKENITGVD